MFGQTGDEPEKAFAQIPRSRQRRWALIAGSILFALSGAPSANAFGPIGLSGSAALIEAALFVGSLIPPNTFIGAELMRQMTSTETTSGVWFAGNIFTSTSGSRKELTIGPVGIKSKA